MEIENSRIRAEFFSILHPLKRGLAMVLFDFSRLFCSWSNVDHYTFLLNHFSSPPKFGSKKEKIPDKFTLHDFYFQMFSLSEFIDKVNEIEERTLPQFTRIPEAHEDIRTAFLPVKSGLRCLNTIAQLNEPESELEWFPGVIFDFDVVIGVLQKYDVYTKSLEEIKRRIEGRVQELQAELHR